MAPEQPGFFEELKRRHVVRAALIYAAAVWALAQGISQLSPVFGLSEKVTLWFVIACVIGFPFWLAFAWYFKFTRHGLAREDDSPQDADAVRRTGRVLDYWIIGILAVAVVLLLTNQLVLQRGRTIREFTATASVPTAHITVKTATVAEPPVTVIPTKSVAVLPFTNESGSKDQQYFSDGLSEDLIISLSQFAGLKVISRNSAFQFRDSTDTSAQIGKLLGVAHLLEGSVQREGDEVRISAMLVDATNGSVLWSQRYDKPYKDLFALQDAITKAVADALQAKLLTANGAVVQSDRPPSGNLAAYNAYLQGRLYFERYTEADYHRAVDSYTTAIRLDPRYAVAYAQLSFTWSALAGEFLGGNGMRQAYAKAREAATTALTLDPNLAASHVARGQVLLFADFDWSDAEVEFRRALQLAPDDGFAKFLLGNLQAVLGHPEQAIALTRQALGNDPRQATLHDYLAMYLAAIDHLGGAGQAARNAIDLAPGSARFHSELAIIEILRGDAKAALRAAQLTPPGGPWRDFALALAQQASGDPAAADDALQELIKKYSDVGGYQIAQVYALRKDPDAVFKWLDRAWANRDPGITFLLYDPFILRYQHDPRFAAFCKKVGLPTTTDAVAMK